MSNAALNAVWQHSQSKGSARLVLLAMADEASDEGELTAYRRSRSHLASKANVDPRTVPRVIASLVELGEVVVLAVGDGRQKSDYRITLPGLGSADRGVASRHPWGGTTPPVGVAPRHPRGGTTPPPSPPCAPDDPVTPTPPTPHGAQLALVPDTAPAARPGPKAVAEAFTEFWELYPRRAGKGDARKAFERAVRKVGIPVLLDAVRAYAADPNQPEDRTKVPHPATWLNQERWADDPLPPAAGSRMRQAIVGNERRRAALRQPPPDVAPLRSALQSTGRATLPAPTRRDQP